jgi:exocyst complex component 4
MDHIQDRWEVTTKTDCVPVQVALQLLDTSSLGRGREHEDFRQTGKALHRGLKAIVNEHHQGFNSSLGTFHKIQSGIQASQERVQTLKASLITARANLTVTRAGLKGLATQSQNYEDMLQVLAQIEKLQAVPEQLDARISEKHFLGAVDTLQDGLRLIRSSNLENIGALADLRIYMNNQETSLTDILLEELHDHLYLKSPYTQNRWRPYSQISADGAVSVRNTSNIGTGIRPLYRFLTTLNTAQPLAHDSSRNPEEDSFEYIHMLIEALNKMGRLEMAVERIEQRLPVELFAVVEKTNQEVDNRYPRHLRTAPSNGWTRTRMRTTQAESREAVLTDLLYTLYSKFEAIAEGHRAVHEVLHGIIQRERIRKSDGLLKGFKELWKLIQSEIRSLLHDYLTTEGSLSSNRDTAGPGSIFKKTPRDKSKKVFKMGDMDKKQLNTEQEELDKILQASVPGLTSNSTKRKTASSGDRKAAYENHSTASHKLLVEPNVFNISMLLPPSLVFLQRLKDTVPPDSDIAVSTLTAFLDDFLVNVFNPQLDDTASELCTQAFMQPDAFQEDPQWADYSQIPILKGTIAFYLLIKDFCKMLDDIPQDQIFTALLLNQLKTYHLRCTEWCQTLLSRVQNEGAAQLKPAPATVKEGGEIVDCLKAIWKGEEQDKEQQRAKLIELLVAYTNKNPLSQFDNVSDQRVANALCLLYSSLQWLSVQLQELRYIVKKEDSADSKQKKSAHRWTMLSVAAMRDGDHPVVLPLTEDSAS